MTARTAAAVAALMDLQPDWTWLDPEALADVAIGGGMSLQRDESGAKPHLFQAPPEAVLAASTDAFRAVVIMLLVTWADRYTKVLDFARAMTIGEPPPEVNFRCLATLRTLEVADIAHRSPAGWRIVCR